MGTRERVIEGVTEIRDAIEWDIENPSFQGGKTGTPEGLKLAKDALKELDHCLSLLKSSVQITLDIEQNEHVDIIVQAHDFAQQLVDCTEDPDWIIRQPMVLPYEVFLLCGRYVRNGDSDTDHAVLVTNADRNNPGSTTMQPLFIHFRSTNIAGGKQAWLPEFWGTPPEHEHQIMLTPSASCFMFLAGEDPEETKRLIQDNGALVVNMVMTAYGLLNMKVTDTTHVEAPAKLNRAREKKGKQPIPDSVQVRIKKSVRDAYKGSGTHASPRPHWRRGHVRQLSTGKRIPVQPHMVMAKEGVPLPKRVEVKA